MYCRICAAFGSTLGKEKIKMKKEVVNLANKRFTLACLFV